MVVVGWQQRSRDLDIRGGFAHDLLSMAGATGTERQVRERINNAGQLQVAVASTCLLRPTVGQGRYRYIALSQNKLELPTSGAPNEAAHETQEHLNAIMAS